MRRSVIGTLFLALACRAQDLTHFEVASIRSSPPRPNLPPGAVPAPSVDGGPGTKDPGQLTFRDIALLALIVRAYDVRSDQVSGPGWPYSQRFDIIAKIPAGATKEQVNVMLQNLLAERFDLQLHHENKILPVYALTVAKGGLKLKESAKDVPPPELPPGTVVGRVGDDGFPTLPLGFKGISGMPSPGHLRWTGQRVTISQLPLGAPTLDHPFVDQTGLTGEYDFKLDLPFTGRPRDPAAAPPPAAPPGGDASEPAPTVFAAVENQLGLKLVLKNLPYDCLVIDHIDKEPSAN